MLNILTKLKKEVKCEALLSVLSLFPTGFIITRMLDCCFATGLIITRMLDRCFAMGLITTRMLDRCFAAGLIISRMLDSIYYMHKSTLKSRFFQILPNIRGVVMTFNR